MGTQRVKEYQEPQEVKKEEVKRKKASEAKSAEAESEGGKRPIDKPPKQKKTRGKKWQKMSVLVDPEKKYPFSEAIELVKKSSYAKFDAKVEAHFKLSPKKGQNIRGTIHLPHGSGKEPKVVIFDSNLAEQIQKGKTDFDILIARPSDMKELSKLAKILGPKGLMPNLKSGTISEKPEEAIKQIKSGQIEYKADAQNNLHQIIGKVLWDDEKLKQNFETLFAAVRQYSPLSATICATMGPGIKLKI